MRCTFSGANGGLAARNDGDNDNQRGLLLTTYLNGDAVLVGWFRRTITVGFDEPAETSFGSTGRNLLLARFASE